MSSLLDVLHKRPPRSRLAAGDTLALATEAPAMQPAEEPAVDVAPAPELELAAAADPLPPGDEATTEMPRPMAEAPLAAGATTALRRWTDAASAAVADVAPGTAAAPTPRPRRRWSPVVGVLLVAVAVFGAFLAWEFAGEEPQTFLAAPAELPPAAAPPAPVPAEPVAAAPVKKKARRSAPAAVVATPDSGSPDDLPWYDQPALPQAAEPAPAAIRITRGTTVDPHYERLRAAWSALQAGDAPRAEALYRETLASDARSVDALLGLGALAARGGRREEARDLFRQVQRLDPRNPTAAAALAALPGSAAGAGTESDLKTRLREQPTAAALHFALGLRYVADARWPDAQLAFFEAVRHEPTNPDYAFNLAVSLDRLGQAGPAASYYERALALAVGHQQFDTAAARARLEALRATGS